MMDSEQRRSRDERGVEEGERQGSRETERWRERREGRSDILFCECLRMAFARVRAEGQGVGKLDVVRIS